eukprot:6357975-Pyramimonas_sp.AAC.1
MPEFEESSRGKVDALSQLLHFSAKDSSADEFEAGVSYPPWVAAASALSFDPRQARISNKFRAAGLYLSGRMKQLSTSFARQKFWLVGAVET